MKKVLLMLIWGATLIEVKAQQSGNYSNYTRLNSWQVYVKGGFTQFYGELNTQKMSGLYGIGVEKRVLPFFSLALDLEGGNLQGSKAEYYNSRFRTDFGELNLIAKVNLTKLFSRRKIGNTNRKEYVDQQGSSNHEQWTRVPADAFKRFNVSVYAGIGAIRFNAVAYDLSTGAIQRFTSINGSGAHTKLGSYTEHGPAGIYYTRERTLPLGVELSYVVSPRVVLHVDGRITAVMNNDKVDATSGSLIQGDNPINGSNTVSNTANDAWGYTAIRLGFMLGKLKE